MKTGSAASTRLSLKTLSIIFFIVVFFVLIDVAISSLVDVYYNFSTSPTGLSLFVAITGVLVAGTYIILKMTERSIREQNMKETYENRITKAVWTIYYLMIAILIFVILQLLIFSEYYTALLSIAPTISYGLAAFLMILLPIISSRGL